MTRQRSGFRRLHVLTLSVLLSLAAALPALADRDADDTPFYVAVGEYYGVSESEVMAVRGHVRAEEVPVVFHIASHAGVSPGQVLQLHAAGYGWMEIGQRLGVGPEAYYVPFEREPGPPYGKAWGYYQRTPRSEWNTIRLSDREIVDLVDLRFVSDHWGMDRSHVADMRAHGRDYVTISRENWPYDFRPGHGPKARHGGRDHDWRDHPGRDHDWIEKDGPRGDARHGDARRGDARRGDRHGGISRRDRVRHHDRGGDVRGGSGRGGDHKKKGDSRPLF